MTRLRSGCVVLFLLASSLVIATPAHAATVVPTGFTDSLVAAIPSPTAVQGTPDGRILVASKPGQLRVIKNGTLLATAINLAAKTCSNQERGLLGVAADPNPATKAIYLFYTLKGSASTGPTPVIRVPSARWLPRPPGPSR